MKFYEVLVPVLTMTEEVHIVQAESEEDAIEKVLGGGTEPIEWNNDPQYYEVQSQSATATEVEVL